ncbi:TPA: threonine/serine dehydratase [Legionella feeleii]|uniref:L-threonine dehydratase catabolic TdcB n=1 Tax=Legionella feeleii TaxID=453 RepID=A0A0W0U2U8_9GAMM|nr:threonine/serine dehydratase [Legionella feeleii]KTD01943.1 L-threonine dehydratase catabolic TdcB [Legionella feeleii]SPX59464.1 L-threonine dehydratase catabolic TdcB [Legionella feeleii]
MFDIKNEILQAEKRIQTHVRETPLDYSVALSRMTNTNTYLKCENLQYTGSFKIRGAFNKLLSLNSSERQQGLVTASSGNHGAAVAFGLKKLHLPGMVFVPENIPSTKIENIRNYDAALEFYATDCMQTEMYARHYAEQHNMIYISPYNDPQIIAGQGTIAAELARQLDPIDVVLVPIGGGGLIAGIAGYLKAVSAKTKIYGCLPKNSPVMAESIKAGQIIDLETRATLSDATAGGIEPDAITFELCEKLVDDYILVSEEEIKDAIITLIKTQHLLIEGAAAVALAALIKSAEQFHAKNVVVILSGGNISLEILRKLLD